jgi:hypothetical protein
LTTLTVYCLPLSSNLQFINFNIDEASVFVITTSSLLTNSSVSFENQDILFGAGFDINLQINSASCPSLILTFSNFAANFGTSLINYLIFKI